MFKVKDYQFETEEEAHAAKSELRAVEYLRTKVNMDEPQAALAIYKQLLDQDIFHTIVGYDFLKGLQNFLRSSPAIDNTTIPQIPGSLAQAVLPKIDKAATGEPEAATGKTENADASEEDAPSQGAAKPEADGQKANSRKPGGKGKTAKGAKKGGAKKRSSKRREKKTLSDEAEHYKKLAQTFLVTTIVLFLAVVAMFVITLTSSTPTVLNYENEVVDKYAGWEESLDAREQDLKEREAAIEEKERAWQKMEKKNGQ